MQEQIIEKATEMYLTLGFKSVTMDDIANEMGISKKTIYQHFANKNDLVEAVTMQMFDTISCGIDEICLEDKNPITEIFEIKNFVMQNLKDEKASPIYQLQKYFPKTFKCLRNKQFDKMEDCVIRNLKKGIELGLYRNDLNLDFVSRIYYSGIHSTKDKEVFPDTMFNAVQLEEMYLEYHLRGIITEKGLKVLEKITNKSN
ncbi:TetR/AcrR family transcriptional regulator [Flavobacterium azooxidireducens]|jgi:AcrR family transcriptional regulator|uniref:TetR/AcrR family transcriptional regulator n=1 Tax=Flavobacterium azooxidireducens TaxID=1871076 RepID=A0ABY4KIZ4_9FLAO|nr:TetR/AcrR family transcriptional regulator [Flavobacterium azooxidireducens]UPQ80814.1 TetR/AcrR family transcriptional regulator [Flavobacterium azooxidireducens]